MLAMSRHDTFSNLQWLLEEHEKETTNYLVMSCASREKLIIEKISNNSIDRYTDDSSQGPFQARINNSDENSGSHDDHRANGGGRVDEMVKKLDHNARERDRRSRINKLYSDLRSVLPSDDGSGKLSIPATISRVLKYIPELQKEVQRHAKKKENLIMSKISREDHQETDLSMNFRKEVIKRRETDRISSSAAAISITQMRDEEIIIQISVPRIKKGCCSGALAYLEMQEAFLVLSASSFKSFDGRVFCNLHIQAQESQIKDAEILKEKIWSFFEEGEELN